MEKIFVARAIFPDVLERLAQHFDVEANQEDRIYPEAELAQKLKGKTAVLTTASEAMSEAVIKANPQIKAICNMAVGYNNIALDAATAAGIMVTNTPDVLNETTADFGWAC
jgi:gluconate 2-dehydrogenase